MLMTTSVKLIHNLTITDFYQKTPNDPTESNRNKVNTTINELNLQRFLSMIKPQKIFKP